MSHINHTQDATTDDYLIYGFEDSNSVVALQPAQAVVPAAPWHSSLRPTDGDNAHMGSTEDATKSQYVLEEHLARLTLDDDRSGGSGAETTEQLFLDGYFLPFHNRLVAWEPTGDIGQSIRLFPQVASALRAHENALRDLFVQRPGRQGAYNEPMSGDDLLPQLYCGSRLSFSSDQSSWTIPVYLEEGVERGEYAPFVE